MDEEMKAKKKLIVNCDICDARKVKEEELKKFEKILVNADYVFVNQHSKPLLYNLPIQWNMDEMVQLEDEEDIEVSYYNGDFEINEAVPSSGKQLLYINGRLLLRPGAENAMKHFIRIYVNGMLSCPESMSAFASQISVNGSIEYYPDDYKILGNKFVMDRYFPIQAEAGGKYFSKEMEVTDSAIDMTLLREKGVHFKAKKVYVLEEKLQDCMKLFNEDVQFYVIPRGYCFVKQDVIFNNELLLKYGNRIYSKSNFMIEAKSREALQQLEGLQVNGTLYLPKEQMEELKQKDVCYKELEFIKGNIIFGKSMITIYPEAIAKEEISLVQCAMVQIDPEISSEEILKKICLINCSVVRCSREQRMAVESVGHKIALIESGQDKITKEVIEEGTQIVNTDRYVL